MAFKFRLEQVLEYRRQLEEQAMQALARAQAEQDAVKKHQGELASELLEQEVKLVKSSELTSAERWLVLSYTGALHNDILGCIKKLAFLEPEVNRLREELVVKAQEKKLLEKLKEKQTERYNKEERVKEMQIYDETATLRFKPGLL